MADDVTRGLPADLTAVLRDQSIIVPQDAAVFELIASWVKAPAPTASAEVVVSYEARATDALDRYAPSSTTPAGYV